MKEFLEYVAQHLVDQPELVKIETEDKQEGFVLKIQVGPGDVGKIIGKDGRTAGALRTLLRAVGAKQGKRALLEIVA
jgi:predicted RNA-binding protein YlqC (UPF0109 family)